MASDRESILLRRAANARKIKRGPDPQELKPLRMSFSSKKGPTIVSDNVRKLSYPQILSIRKSVDLRDQNAHYPRY